MATKISRQFYGLSETVERLKPDGPSYSTLWRAVHAGDVRAERIGSVWMIPASELARLRRKAA